MKSENFNLLVYCSIEVMISQSHEIGCVLPDFLKSGHK